MDIFIVSDECVCHDSPVDRDRVMNPTAGDRVIQAYTPASLSNDRHEKGTFFQAITARR